MLSDGEMQFAMKKCVDCGKIVLFNTGNGDRCPKCNEVFQANLKKELFQKRQHEIFSSAINSIPEVTIERSGAKSPLRKSSDLAGLKYSSISARTQYSKYGEFISIDIETCGLKATDPILEIAERQYRNMQELH